MSSCTFFALALVRSGWPFTSSSATPGLLAKRRIVRLSCLEEPARPSPSHPIASGSRPGLYSGNERISSPLFLNRKLNPEFALTSGIRLPCFLRRLAYAADSCMRDREAPLGIRLHEPHQHDRLRPRRRRVRRVAVDGRAQMRQREGARPAAAAAARLRSNRGGSEDAGSARRSRAGRASPPSSRNARAAASQRGWTPR